MRRAEPVLEVAKAWESQKLEHDRPLLCCQFSPCGKYVFAGAQDERLLRWSLADGAKTSIAGHESWVAALAFHPSESRLLTGDLHGVLRCWDYAAEAPTPIWTVVDAHRTWVQAAVATKDGARWVTSGTDGVVRLWNSADGKPLGELGRHETEVYALATHPDGVHLASGDLLGRIVVWNLQTGARVRTLDAKPLHTRKDDFLADVGGVRSLAFSATGERLAAGGMTDAESNAFCPGKPAVLEFDFAAGTLRRTLRPKLKSDGPVKGLAYLPGDLLAAQGEHLNATSSLEFFAADQEPPVHAIARESGYALSLHPDGRRLAVASFATHGAGGNGRNAKRGEYAANRGAVVIYSLFDKSAAV